jgi:hypothetical protein
MKKTLILLLLAVGFFSWSFYMVNTYQKVPIVSRICSLNKILSREENLTEIDYWETLVKQNPSYPDGWAKLAELWQENGRKDLAKYSADRAFELAPFREDLEDIKRQLQ